MKTDYLDPFVESTISVLSRFDSDFSVYRNDPVVVNSPYRTRGVCCHLGLTGSLNGQVIYDMELETARRLAGVMNGQPSLEMNDLGRSTLQELSNMISGNAVINLSGSIVDGSLDITTPSLYVGEGTEIIERPGQSFIQTCLNTDHGTFFINLSAKETVTS